MKRVFSLFLVVLMVLTLAFCGQADAAAPQKNIYCIIKGLGNSYWAVLQAGATQAGKDFGCNVIIQGIPNEIDIEIQTGMLQNAISARADGIVLAVADSKAQVNAVNDAFASGIPLVVVDTKPATDNYSVSWMVYNYATGEIAAAELMKKMGDKLAKTDPGEVAIQIGSTGSATIAERMEGFKDYWAKNAPPAWKLLLGDIQVNDGKIDLAVQFGQDFITAYPNLTAFFSPNNGSTVGFATALRELKETTGRTDITMVGFDFSKEMQQIIRDPDINVSTMLQEQYLMGYNGVRDALTLANGGTVAQKDNFTSLIAVDITNIDSDTVKTAAGPSMLTPDQLKQ